MGTFVIVHAALMAPGWNRALPGWKEMVVPLITTSVQGGFREWCTVSPQSRPWQGVSYTSRALESLSSLSWLTCMAPFANNGDISLGPRATELAAEIATVPFLR